MAKIKKICLSRAQRRVWETKLRAQITRKGLRVKCYSSGVKVWETGESGGINTCFWGGVVYKNATNAITAWNAFGGNDE
jgi:hypothetical protein